MRGRNRFEILALVLLVLLTPSGAASFGAGMESPGVVRNSDHTLTLAEGATAPSTRIEDLAWLAGYWVGAGLGGETEELWSPPVGDRMHGVFTLRREGRLVFSETMVLVEREGVIDLRIKHFDADFVGWEEKAESVDFPLLRVGEGEAFFSGLTFRREGADTLRIFLVLSHGGERTEESFVMQRVDL